MKAFKIVQWGQPGAYVDVAKPSPGPGDVLIRMKAAGLCRSDLDMVDSAPGSAPYANSIDAGYTMGHENAGYVEALGSAVADLRVGEAVDAAVTAYHAIRTAVGRLKPGTTAALIGIGGLGSYGVQFVRVLTAARIFAIDNIESRLQAAKKLGADEAVLFEGDGAAASAQVSSLTSGRGVDVIVDFVGSADTLKLAAKISRPQGRIVLVGMQGGTLEVGWGLLATSCEFAISLGSTRQDLREVCDLARKGKLRIDVERFDFDDVQKAYDALRAGTLTGRAVVVFP